MNSGPLTGVRLFESYGRISATVVLLTPGAAALLVDIISAALKSPESIAAATWPREICNIEVPSPPARGVEHYLSLHLDAGRDPFSKWEIRRRGIVRTLICLFAVIGIVCSVRWLLTLTGS